MKMTAVALLALASAFLLVGISYILFPDQIPQQPPISKSIPNVEPLSDQIFWAIQWIGLAAFIAITAVGAIFLASRIKSKKTPNLH
jgi:cytochrome oxidase assembly protein ShyY1